MPHQPAAAVRAKGSSRVRLSSLTRPMPELADFFHTRMLTPLSLRSIPCLSSSHHTSVSPFLPGLFWLPAPVSPRRPYCFELGLIDEDQCHIGVGEAPYEPSPGKMRGQTNAQQPGANLVRADRLDRHLGDSTFQWHLCAPKSVMSYLAYFSPM
jgi:hypothetical protein